MAENIIGISDIALYVPRPKIELRRLVDYRIEHEPLLARKLQRALLSTGQQALRYPDTWEDSVTLGAQAAFDLVSRQGANFDLQHLRYLVVGTETAIDHAKSISAYIGGMLQRTGLKIPERISSFQIQHACAGGTLAIASIGALLALSRYPQDCGIAICSDIARYEPATTAEITQGAGAAAILIERNPRLIELDLSRPGYASRDVDDFFRPLGAVTARVKGSYSIKCYNQALLSAFEDYCRQLGDSPANVLLDIDLFALHVPFVSMARMALRKLIATYSDIGHAEVDRFLAERGVAAALAATAEVGNIYSGSLYLSLAFLLADRYRAIGRKIVGKRLLLCSYGSGNTMTLLGGRIAASAPEIIAGWDLRRILDSSRPAEIAHYKRWVASGYQAANNQGPDTYKADVEAIPSGSFYLDAIRTDGYREYGYRS